MSIILRVDGLLGNLAGTVYGGQVSEKSLENVAAWAIMPLRAERNAVQLTFRAVYWRFLWDLMEIS
jgi:hypothetical protein